jgi:hypothetical protein
MADINAFAFFLRHLRADASSHILHFRRGKLARAGRGLSFWYSPLSASIAELPADVRELPLLFHGRSADFQDVTAQGVITYRVESPETLARHIDFSIDLRRGVWLRQPLEKLALSLSELAQQHAWAYIAHAPLKEVLREGQGMVRERIEAALARDPTIGSMGLALVSVRVSSVRPSADLEKALEAPVRERIQQESDEAAFQRRAVAVEKERAIQENELQSQIELARREEQLIAQQGQNARRKAGEDAEAQRIATESEASRSQILAAASAGRMRALGQAQAETIGVVEKARAEGEREHMAAYEGVPPAVLLGLAARGLAGKLQKIEHLNVTPDLLAPVLAQLAESATRRLDAAPAKQR